MVNHYTVAKKRRTKDYYTPNGEMGKRPDYATVVYCNLIRRTYKKTPIIIGGIEASLRRLSHYDYWEDKLHKSILFPKFNISITSFLLSNEFNKSVLFIYFMYWHVN